MKIVHSLEGYGQIQKEVQEEVGFLLTNKKGAYLSLFPQITSRYQGWFVPLKSQLYKIIENIRPINSPQINQLKNNFWSAERKGDYFEENFFLPENYKSLVYELSSPQEVELTLDIKESYDNREFGHFYEILTEKDIVLIKYHRENEYQLYLAIKPDILNYQEIGQWLKRDYWLDQKRNSPPYQRYVYKALRLKGQKIVFSVDSEKEKAINEARFVFEKAASLKKSAIEKAEKLSQLTGIKDKEIKIAYLAAANSLASLTVSDKDNLGIYAGLPWFFQYWARDEAISLKALGNFLLKEAKKILFKLLINLREDGRLPPQLTENADGVGWLFKRAADLISEKKFKEKEIAEIKKNLEKSIKGLLEHHTQNNLAMSNPRETWMDTQERKGAPIEIQALRLNIYQLAYQLTKKTKYLKLEKQLKETVYQKFWNGQFLADGHGDFTIRPNIFLAAYLYPKLLKKSEWLKCFENILPKLWLAWGGLSTIDKTNSLFCDSHTGQDPKSYHNGDAWFYLNNLASLVLYQFGQRKFIYQIDKILEASTQEILWQGTVAHHGELSSAKEITSEGCWSQAWSSALYIELINKLEG